MPKNELAVVVVVAAVPNSDPCVPEDENMLPADVVFTNVCDAADPNKDDAEVTDAVAGGFVVTASADVVDGGVDG